MKKNLAVFGFLVLIGLGITSVAQALPGGGTGYNNIYYSDETFTEVVGEWYMECNSSPWHWGVRSRFVQATQWDCGGGGGGGGNLGCGSGFWICQSENPPNTFHNCTCV